MSEIAFHLRLWKNGVSLTFDPAYKISENFGVVSSRSDAGLIGFKLVLILVANRVLDSLKVGQSKDE
jgi:hypothetical protein